ncbi:hypothetical protein Tco_1099445, partial [Tanacetum coccineum]
FELSFNRLAISGVSSAPDVCFRGQLRRSAPEFCSGGLLQSSAPEVCSNLA